MKKITLFLTVAVALLQLKAVGKDTEQFGLITDLSLGFPYAARVGTDGSIQQLQGMPNAGAVFNSVSINCSGRGIGGGLASGNGYVAHINPDGWVNELNGPFSSPGGQIFSVSMNSSGLSVIGGQKAFGPVIPYAGFVTNRGEIISLSGLPTDETVIRSVDINSNGTAIIGGHAGPTPTAFAALATLDGGVTPLSGLPPTLRYINSVAINSTNHGIIGGNENDFGGPAYAALVEPSGAATTLGGLPIGFINSVAINSRGSAIIGGIDFSGPGNAYAALVEPSGQVNMITVLPGVPGSSINGVAINESGAAIIGGITNSFQDAYAALVSPNGYILPLSGLPLGTGGAAINVVAINNSGAALLGGTQDGYIKAFAALVAPNGTVTKLPLPSNANSIGSVDLQNCYVDPISYGPGNTYADPLFALSTVILRNHISQPIEYNSSKGLQDKETLSLVADAQDKIYPPVETNPSNQPQFAVWFSPFGLYAHYKKENKFPSLRDRSLGAILGFDYNGWENGMLGGGVAYAFQDVHYSQSKGKAKINQEFATFYGAWYGSYCTIEGALWGGIYQMRNDRTTLGFISSRSSVHGGLLSPHLSVQTPIKVKSMTLTPYVELDWANNWQGKVREHGTSGLNVRLKSHYTSILRSEVGLRFTQSYNGKYGIYKFEEGASYVNKTPFNAKKVSTYYVGSFSNFNLQLFSNKVQNLGALFLETSFTPNNTNIPYISLLYQGEWGVNQNSNTLAMELRHRF